MNLLALFLLLALPIAGLTKPPAKKSAQKKTTPASVTDTLMQMERDWSQAGINRDVKTLNRIMAEDWVSIDVHGETTTKAQALAGLKSGESETQSIELGEMKVHVFGTAAIVTGTNVERSTYKGRDSSGKYAFTDVFVKRDGRWQAIASQATKIEK